MTRCILKTWLLIVMLSASLPSVALGEEKSSKPAVPKGFVALFNGKDLTGWKGLGHYDPAKYRALSAEKRRQFDEKNMVEFKKHWWVEKSELVNDGRGPYATPVKDYGDFELRLQYKLSPKTDSGIYLRGVPQVQIWDTTEEGGSWKHGAKRGSGGLWNNKKKGRWPRVHADKPIGQWNTLAIKMIGQRVTVRLNGKLVVDNIPLENYWNAKKRIHPTGPIQLQTHGGEVRLANIFLRDIPRKP